MHISVLHGRCTVNSTRHQRKVDAQLPEHEQQADLVTSAADDDLTPPLAFQFSDNICVAAQDHTRLGQPPVRRIALLPETFYLEADATWIAFALDDAGQRLLVDAVPCRVAKESQVVPLEKALGHDTWVASKAQVTIVPHTDLGPLWQSLVGQDFDSPGCQRRRQTLKAQVPAVEEGILPSGCLLCQKAVTHHDVLPSRDLLCPVGVANVPDAIQPFGLV